MAAKAIEGLRLSVGRMELFGARTEEPTKACIDEVGKCQLFVGIYAYRYGFIPPGLDKSITEAEYNEAERLNIPRFCFIIQEDFAWVPKHIDSDISKISEFKARVSAAHVRETFTNPESLAAKVATSLGRHLLANNAVCSQSLKKNDLVLRDLLSQAKQQNDKIDKILEAQIIGSQERMDVINAKMENELKNRFPLGYVLFTMLEPKFVIPSLFEAPSKMWANWGRCRFTNTKDGFLIYLPSIVLKSAWWLEDLQVKLRNEVGMSVRTHFDSRTNRMFHLKSLTLGGGMMDENPDVSIIAEVLEVSPAGRIVLVGIGPYEGKTR